MNLISSLGFLWNQIFYFPIVNLIVFIYKYTGHNLGLAIIILTILIRLLLWPLMKSQIDSFKKMQKLRPQIDKLKAKYKDDKSKFQEEQLKLYKESGVNPVGSCLPLLIQIPFIYSVYNVIRTISISKNASVFNNIVYSDSLRLSHSVKFNTDFLGINLAKDAASIGFHNISAALPYIILAVLVGLTQFMASKVSLPVSEEEIVEAVEESSSNRKSKKDKQIKVVESKTAKNESLDPEQFSKMMSTQMLYIFPLILTWISLGYSGLIPSGLSVYWIVQSLCVVIQTLILQGKFTDIFRIKKQ